MQIEEHPLELAGEIAQVAFAPHPITASTLGSPDRTLEVAAACGWQVVSRPVDFDWVSLSDLEVLDRLLGLASRPPTGRVLLIPDYCFTRKVVFVVEAAALREFVASFRDRYGEPFFNGIDVLVVDLSGRGLWLFHHEERLFAAWKEECSSSPLT